MALLEGDDAGVLASDAGGDEDVQGSAKRRGLGCVDSLPGSAWL